MNDPPQSGLENIGGRLDRLAAKLSATPSIVDAVMRRVEGGPAFADRRGLGGRRTVSGPWLAAGVSAVAALAACVGLFIGLHLRARPATPPAIALAQGPAAVASQPASLPDPLPAPGGTRHAVPPDPDLAPTVTDPGPATSTSRPTRFVKNGVIVNAEAREQVLFSGSRWGFIDPAGRVVIEPQFERAGKFSEGKAAVRVNGKWGYAGPDGGMLIQPAYEQAAAFSEGHAAVKTAPGWSYIDTQGRALPGGPFEWADPFHDGLAPVKSAGKFGLVNVDGGFAVPTRFAWIGRYAEGLAPARERPDGKWGYIDAAGNWAIPATFDRTADFREGRAPVQSGGKWGLIDRAGRLVVEPKYDFVCPFGFRDGLCRVRLNGKYGFIDRTGAVVIPLKYWNARIFSEGVCRVEEKNDETGDWGYIDTTGRLLFRHLRATTLCSHGLIRHQVEDGHVFLARATGAEAIPKLEHADDFSEGLAAFAVNVNYKALRELDQMNRDRPGGR